MTKQPDSDTETLGYEPDGLLVTPAMIKAGAFVLEQKGRFFDERALAQMVYNAMWEVRPARDQ